MTAANSTDDGLSVFLNVRPRLFGIAYRMVRSAAEAEDIVQDVWIRWQTTDRSVVRDAPAFLATTTARLAINVIKSARSRRETNIGPWLPEPVDTSADPGVEVERGEALDFAVLVLLEKLSPTERVAYVLREAFDYSYREIAHILCLGEANARQVVTRARQHLADDQRALLSQIQAVTGLSGDDRIRPRTEHDDEPFQATNISTRPRQGDGRRRSSGRSGRTPPDVSRAA
jgi:RNA polymerase sigma-70 factor (ECF subfamily)